MLKDIWTNSSVESDQHIGRYNKQYSDNTTDRQQQCFSHGIIHADMREIGPSRKRVQQAEYQRLTSGLRDPYIEEISLIASYCYSEGSFNKSKSKDLTKTRLRKELQTDKMNGRLRILWHASHCGSKLCRRSIPYYNKLVKGASAEEMKVIIKCSWQFLIYRLNLDHTVSFCRP